jgi:hypothetical protein
MQSFRKKNWNMHRQRSIKYTGKGCGKEKQELQKQVSLGWDLDRLIRNYLKQELLFTDQEIRNNIDLFRVAQKELDLMLELSTLKGKSRDKKNPKGYIINALKGKVKDKEEL